MPSVKRQTSSKRFRAINDYQGYLPHPSRPAIDVVKVQDLTPEILWDRYIRRRKPLIIDGFPTDSEWQADKWTNLSHLSSLAGHVTVKIEPIHPDLGHFGTAAKRQKVNFSEFIQRLKDSHKRKGDWYLTTQYESDEDGTESNDERSDPAQSQTANGKRKRNPSLSQDDGYNSESSSSSSSSLSSSSSSPLSISIPMSDPDLTSLPAKFRPPPLDPLLPSPTHALADDFPLQPKLMGNLVLQQTNLWLGNCQQGKSSGLHHDFHDNLYALLSGRKRFVLFPPPAHIYLRPRGTVERVHHNGLLEYTPRGCLHIAHPFSNRLPLRPDGLPPSEAAKWLLLARRQSLRNACDRGAKETGEGHVPGGKRKGKARMTQEMEEALVGYEAAVDQVARLIALEEASEDEDDQGDLLPDVSDLDDDDDEDEHGMEFSSDDESEDVAILRALLTVGAAAQGRQYEEVRRKESSGDLDSEEDEDFDTERFYQSVDGTSEVGQAMEASREPSLPPQFERVMLRAQQGDPQAIDMLAHLQRSLAQQDEESDSDVEESATDLRPDDVLRIPHHPDRNLPGGLRRDSDTDDYDDDFEYADGLTPTGVLLMGADDPEGLIGETDESEGDDLNEQEELMALNALRRQIAQRLVRSGGQDRTTGEEPRRYIADQGAPTQIGEHDTSTNSDESDADSGEGTKTAPLLATLARDNGDHQEEDQSVDGDNPEEVGPDESDLDSSSSPLFQSEVDDDYEEEDENSDDSGWGQESDAEDGEAVLAALEAQARVKHGYQPLRSSLGKFSPMEVKGRKEETSDDDEEEEADVEPLSFSLISPSTLHRYFGIPDSIFNGTEQSQGTKVQRKSRTGQGSVRPLAGCPRPLVVNLLPGQMLYLPASWWHEVTSEAGPPTKSEKGTESMNGGGKGKDKHKEEVEEAAEANVHMALNWWFHPPDNLSPLPKAQVANNGGVGSAKETKSQVNSFDEPYCEAIVWDLIRAKVKRRLERARRAARAWKEGGMGSKRRKNGGISSE